MAVPRRPISQRALCLTFFVIDAFRHPSLLPSLFLALQMRAVGSVYVFGGCTVASWPCFISKTNTEANTNSRIAQSQTGTECFNTWAPCHHFDKLHCYLGRAREGVNMRNGFLGSGVTKPCRGWTALLLEESSVVLYVGKWMRMNSNRVKGFSWFGHLLNGLYNQF